MLTILSGISQFKILTNIGKENALIFDEYNYLAIEDKIYLKA